MRICGILTSLAWLGMGLPVTACAYRFTNEHIKRPEGIRTVAVEAVYDTSREVVPHELLWEALQDAFAADGHLHLAPQSSADALVRAHLKQALISPAGTATKIDVDPDPKAARRNDGTPEDPVKFRRLNHAGEYHGNSILTATVDIEVWSLRTRTLLMRRTYPMSSTFKAFRGPDVEVSAGNNWLRYEEAGDAAFARLARGVAQQVVKDLIVQ